MCWFFSLCWWVVRFDVGWFMIEIISVMCFIESDFWVYFVLGLLLWWLVDELCLCVYIVFENMCGLFEIYNFCIFVDDGVDDDVLVFIYDDVWFDDYFVVDCIFNGFMYFDVLGVVGNCCIVFG